MTQHEYAPVYYHLDRTDWKYTPEGERRGYIQPRSLQELWFHTGTTCNLRCPFCYEGAYPGNNRLQPPTLNDLRPFMKEAVKFGTTQFSFTGGEPFVIRDMVDILDFALDVNPCLVLTNATEPLLNRLVEMAHLLSRTHPLTFRVSLDFPDPDKHDQGRGAGNFQLALKVMGELHRLDFRVAVARQSTPGENAVAVNAAYVPFFREVGLPGDTHVVYFSELFSPGAHPPVPHITEHCMRTSKTKAQCERFMCNYSKMVIKKDGRLRVYACTLVDDDDDYDLGGNLTESMRARIMLKHHRCFGCFAAGTSCSEI